jgi:hypothetical protein
MNFIDQELEAIDVATNKAIELIEQGSFRQALKKINRFNGSFCCSESNRAKALIEALILFKRGKKAQTRALICQKNYVAWGSDDLKAIFRMTCPEVDPETKLYCFSVVGGFARLGCFSCFGDNDWVDYEVLANSQQEALAYIHQFANYAAPEAVKVASLQIMDCPTDSKYRGILANSPFYQKLEF